MHPKKFVAYTGAGLGDFFIQYFFQQWSKIETIRKFGFRAPIHCFHFSHNPASFELTKFIPNTTQEYYNYCGNIEPVKEKFRLEKNYIDNAPTLLSFNTTYAADSGWLCKLSFSDGDFDGELL